MRHRYFVRTQYGVIKIKSLSYNYLALFVNIKLTAGQFNFHSLSF
ncbi:hypothetical protein ARSQ2_01888 [Arsenophonus endosymbiont of Bemisia tabaci Q2]|nr:hypothetical protein ARSQ2_01888 [Arsenophonus endosymbiont of Bemisia tabaci Q2]